jgi:hypothetical protein
VIQVHINEGKKKDANKTKDATESGKQISNMLQALTYTSTSQWSAAFDSSLVPKHDTSWLLERGELWPE